MAFANTRISLLPFLSIMMIAPLSACDSDVSDVDSRAVVSPASIGFVSLESHGDCGVLRYGDAALGELGLCEDRYAWSCAQSECIDSAGRLWAVEDVVPLRPAEPGGEDAAAATDLAAFAWAEFDSDGTVEGKKYCSKDGSVCGACTGQAWPPGVICYVKTLNSTCLGKCDLGGCGGACFPTPEKPPTML